MINIPRGKCGSMNIGKNGTTAAGTASGSSESRNLYRCIAYSFCGAAEITAFEDYRVR